MRRLTVGTRQFEYDRDDIVEQAQAALSPAGIERNTTENSDAIYKANISYDVAADSLLYLQWSQRFRSGRPQAALPSDLCDVDSDGLINERALLKAGAVILLSTDAGVFSSNTTNSSAWKAHAPPRERLVTLGDGHFSWLLAVEQKGMKPMDALMAATLNIAKAYKMDKDLGSLEPGKLADLLKPT